MLDRVDLLICGAGPVGCTIAERAATTLGWNVLVIDRRNHIAGNCHDAPHPNGLLTHRYGPHYFRTNDPSLVRYLSRFTDWIPGNYKVKSLVGGRLYPFPINLTTLETFFDRKLTPRSAEQLLREKRVMIESPRNSEEFVLSRVGRELYENFYLNYTLKQWGVHPRELPAGVCGRIPVRLNRDDQYVEHRYRIMPAEGFSAMFSKMLDHPRIRLELGCDFKQIRHWVIPRHATVYCGPIDEHFDHCFGKLSYRSLRFEYARYEKSYHQPCAQINYPNDTAHTRSVEYKHVTGQEHPETVVGYETPTADGEPFYPVGTEENRRRYEKYRQLAEKETFLHDVYFCGRLAQYRYFNTDEVITEALSCFETLRARAAIPRRESVLSSR